MTPDRWPPPVTPDSTYVEVMIRDDETPRRRYRRVRARQVRLWGETVSINDAGDAHCDGCLEFVPVAVLSRRPNRHRVGLHRGALTTYGLPMGADEERSEPPWPSW